MVEHTECVWCEGWYNQSNSHFRMTYIRMEEFTGRRHFMSSVQSSVGEMLSGLGLKWMDRIHDGCLEMAKTGEVRPQDRPPEPKIINTEFGMEGRGYIKVMVTLDNHELVHAFSYYDDELIFYSQELVGLTLQQARDLFHEKDVRYLQS